MKSVIKKVLFVLIALIVILGYVSNVYATTSTLSQLQTQYPTGSQWNGTYYGMSPNSTSNYIIRIVATECAGFAALMYYNYYGFDPYYYAHYEYDLNKVKSGDIVRYQEDGQNVGHSVWVLSREGDICTIAECNYDGHNSVRWGVKRSISELSYYFKYIMASEYEIGAEDTYLPSLGIPEGVRVTTSDKTMSVTWSAVTNATSYQLKVYKAADWDAGRTTSPVLTSMIDARVTNVTSDLEEVEEYYAVIVAYRGNYPSRQGGKTSNLFDIGKPIKGISLTASKKQIEVGETLQLNVTYTPSDTDMNKKIDYSSSNNEFAGVSESGVVKGLEVGTVTITAKSINDKVSAYSIKVVPRATNTTNSNTTNNTTNTANNVTNNTVNNVTNNTANNVTNNTTTNTNTNTNTTPVNKPVGIECRTHVQDDGWHDYVKMGEKAGSEGRSKRMEAIQIRLNTGNYSGGIKYASHVQNIGWQGYVTNNQISGTEGRSLRVEAIKIELTGEIANHYDIYYRTHCQDYGWLGWAKNGYASGTAGRGLRLEALQLYLVEKGKSLPKSLQSNAEPYIALKIGYSTHVQDHGWLSTAYDGDMSGTQGESRRLEALKINLVNQEFDGDIEYQAHIENIGWGQGIKRNGQIAGTQGQSLRLEAITIKLTGTMAQKYDIYYRGHVQNFGWLDWAKNGGKSGSEGYAYRLEAIQVKLVPKGGAAPGKTTNCFKKYGQ